MIDTYTIYCQHCIARGQTPPTREWWDNACTKRKPTLRLAPNYIVQSQADFDFDIAVEQREGYAYD